MNWVDFLIVLLLIFFTLEGLGRSFISELLDFLSFVLAFFFSIRFYNYFAQIYQANFQTPHSVATVIGFVTVWFLIEVVLFSTIHFILINAKLYSTFNKYLITFSPIPAFLRGVVFVALVLLLFATFPIQPRIKRAVNESLIGSEMLSGTQSLEEPLKKVFGGISNKTLTFFTIKPKSEERVNLGFKTTEYVPNPLLEQMMVEMVNNERGQKGLKPLSQELKLRDAGRLHSGDMFTRGYFSHYSPEGKSVAERATGAGIDYLVIGENLAYAPSLELSHKGLMNSEGHRANILSEDFGKIGVGIQDGGVYGIMVTQVFSN